MNRMLNRWAELKPNWDGEGGSPPSRHVVDCSQRFVKGMMEEAITPPTPFIAGDGEIGFRWHQGEFFASVAFLDDKTIVAFCLSPAMMAPYTLDQPADVDSDLSELLHHLQGFTNNNELDDAAR